MTSNFKKIAYSIVILFLLLTCHSDCYSQQTSRIVNYNAEYQHGDGIKIKYAFPEIPENVDPDKHFQIVFTFDLAPEQIEADIAGTMTFDQENGTIQIRGRDGNLQSKGGLTLNGVVKFEFEIESIPFATLEPILVAAAFTISNLVKLPITIEGEDTFLEVEVGAPPLYSKSYPIGSLTINPFQTWDESEPFNTLLLDDDATVKGGIYKLVRAELDELDAAILIAAAITAGGALKAAAKLPSIAKDALQTIIQLAIGKAAIGANLGFLSTTTLSGESITVNGEKITNENQTIQAPGLDLSQNSYTVNSSYNEKFTYKLDFAATSDVTLEFNPLGIPIWNYDKIISEHPIVPIVAEKEVDLNFTSNQTTFPITQTSTVPTVQAPVPQGTIPEQALTTSSSSNTVNVASYFSSENNLSYSVRATPSGIVSASVSGSRVTISPRAAGVATVTVTASNTTDTSLTAVQTIAVVVRQSGATIVRPNTDPTFTSPSSSTPSDKGLGDDVSVKVQVRTVLNVRSKPSIHTGEILDQIGNITGIITDGPRQADNFTWWKIDWDPVGIPEGWSAEVIGGKQVLLRRPPDLEITRFDVSPSTVGSGEDIELEVRIRNNGPGKSAPTDVSFYYSENRHDDLEELVETAKECEEAPKECDLRIPGTGKKRVDSLRERRSTTLKLTVPAPPAPDRYYYGALLPNNILNTDYKGDLDEDEAKSNNLASEERVDVISPDYIVESISASKTILEPGQSFTLRATVRNQGIGEPTRSAILRYYRSSDASISTSDTRVGSDSVRVLDTDETGKESISLTAPSTPGVYYYGACVLSVTNESNKNNNCSAAVAITVQAADPNKPAVPDLVVDTPTTSTTTLGPGVSFTLNATVRNKGTANSPATTFRWYRSPNSKISSNDTEIGSANISSLSAGATSTQQIILTTPAAAGTYYYGGCVESSTDESDTTNNCSAAITITVQNSAPTTVGTISGQTLTVGDTPVRLDVSTYFSDPNNTSLTYTASSSALNVVSAEAAGVSGSNLTLSPIAEGSATITVTASDGELTATQTFSVTVNPMPVTISESPDLIVSLTATENLVTPNGYFELQATVRNQGKIDTLGAITLRYFVSSDATISTDDVEIGTDSVGSLKSNLSEDEDHGLRASLNPGLYYYYACVDSVTGEENTDNNCSNVLTITVRGPDLIVDSVSVDLLGQTGGINPNGNFKLNASVKNQGTGTSGSTTLRYYVSSDNVFSSDDTEVETITLNSIGIGISSNQLSNTIQSSYISGVFYCFVCVDSLTDEVNTNNNCSTPIQITVRNVAPATKGIIAAQTLRVGEPKSVDVSQSFTDQNKDTLTYRVSSSDNNVATVATTQSQVTITPRRVGSTTITVTASDSEFSATQTISVTVAVPNRAPVAIGTISVRTMTVGYASAQVDVSGNFQDADGDTLTYAVTSNNTSVATVSVSGSQLTITPVGTGSTTITVTASDGTATATQTLSVIVEEPNRAPIAIGTIASRTLRVRDTSEQVDVSSNFQDADGDTLTYAATSNNTSVATVSVSGSQLTITPVGTGSTTITVTASDGKLRATRTISVTVADANRAPVTVGIISARTLTVGASPLVIDVSNNFQDPEGNSLSYTVSSNNTRVATASVSGSQITITPVAAGSVTITVTASDGELTATQTIAVAVTTGLVANRAPITVGAISAQTLTFGDSPIQIGVSGNFQDPDNDRLTFTVSSNALGVATVSVSGSQVTITPVAAGSATITVIASDGELTATQTIAVTVATELVSNRVPITVGVISAQTLTVGGSSIQIDVSNNFQDPDNDTLRYTVSSTALGVATVSVSGSQVTITPVGAGSATITVTASDGALSGTQTISVTVTAAPVANKAPITVGTISARTLTVGAVDESSADVDVSSNFNDPDNDTLTYTVSSSATSTATVSVSGSQVTITAVAAGSATVTVTANDGTLTTTQTISVTVNAAVPEETWMSDANLRAGVREALGLRPGESLTKLALQGLTELSITESSLSDLSGLEHATNLSVLVLHQNQIDDITPLQNLTNITDLILWSNQISDITPLENITSLKNLSVYDNSINNITPLQNLTSLWALNMNNNEVSDISPLEDLTALTTLQFHSNQVSDISSLAGLTALTDLYFNDNQVSDITVLKEMSALIHLFLWNNQVSDITPLQSLVSLKTLGIKGNQVSDVSSLSNLTKITRLQLDRNEIRDITRLEDLTTLTELGLAYNQITNVRPLEDLMALTYLTLSDNPITDYAPLRTLKASSPNVNIDIDLTNKIPTFTEGSSTTRTVAENTASGVNIGNAISATDEDEDDTLTYSLGGTDAESFSIVSTSGQLQTSAALDYETTTSYSVTVTVYDGNSGGNIITVIINVTDVANAAPSTQISPIIPENTALLSNYPNPFNPETWIPYQLAKPANVTLTIYNMRGVVVRQLALGYRAAGVYHSRPRAAHWDGRNNIDEKVATGIYFVKFTAGDYTATRKMLIKK